MDYKKLETFSDDRGTLVEAFKFPTDGQLFYVVAPPNQTRGNHYHKIKTEHFLVVYGSALMKVRDRKDKGVVRVELGGDNPMVVSVPPNHTHSITSGSDGCIFIVWVDTLFDYKKPDTFREEV